MKVHQTLHGYSSGHQLLGSSIELSREHARVLTMQSDLSGTTIVPEFDGYLSGFPLAGSGYYVLSRTWYAYEQNRPGCVWTHSLLVSQDDVGDFPLLEAKDTLFHRPDSINIDNHDYESELSISANETIEVFVSPQFEEVVEQFFGEATSPVILSATSSKEYEDAVATAWLLQWANLKYKSSFSLGSLSNRTLSNASFGLQVVPKSAFRNVLRENKCKPTGQNEPRSAWIDGFCERLQSKWFVNNLIAILRQVDLPEDRRIYPLVVYLAEESQILDAQNLVSSLRSLSDSNNGFGVVQGVLETAITSDATKVFGVERCDLIKELFGPNGVSSDAQLTTGSAYDLARKAVQKSKSNAIVVMECALQPGITLAGQFLVRAILQTLSEQTLGAFIVSHRDEIPLVVSIEPEMATVTEVWQGSRRQRYEICDALSQNVNVTDEMARRIVFTVLRAQAHDSAHAVVRCLGSHALSAVLDWFDGSAFLDPSLLARAWRAELRDAPAVIHDWLLADRLSLRLASVGLCSLCIDPSDEIIADVPADIWHRSLDHEQTYPKEVVSRSYSFLLALAFRQSHGDWANVMAATFGRVHALMMDRDLGYEEWIWLSEELPNLGFAWNWDRAERLRRGAIDKFVDLGWPAHLFAKCFGNPDAWRLAIESCRQTENGCVLLAKLTSDDAELEQWQRAEFE